MRIVVSLLLGFAAISALSNVAEARDGCGPGFYFNGYRCRPMEREYKGLPRVVPERRYYGGYAIGMPPIWIQPEIRDPRCGRPNYTIQDGVCKPYAERSR